MEYKSLGKSDLNVSRIAFGCMSLKGLTVENENVINAAFDKGINYFDTADLYEKGMNESLLGKALRQKRQQVIIATKVGNQWREDGSGWNWNPHKEYILKEVEESLKRLKTDYIDVYQLHGGTIEDPIDETIEAFELLKAQGKIRYYGISSIRPNVIREYVNRSNIISVMMQYSLLDRRPEDTCFSLLEDEGIGILVRGAVAGGLLVDKPAKTYLSYSKDQVNKAVAALLRLSSANRSPAQTAIKFVLQKTAVSSAVVGIRTLEQLRTAVETISAPDLNESEIGELEQSIEKNFYQEHR